ncbi:MAG: putative metal-binding motif-containing protein, partial [Nanoarchaeota archaeon]
PSADTGCPDELDCNDNNPEINPGVSEVPGDGIDNDCNGIIDDACTDNDHDGYNASSTVPGLNCGLVDCDDANIFINPGATELCSDAIDNDCDGNIDGDDVDCADAMPATDCTIDPDMTMWINCDAENINSANEGDTVYMVLWTEGCDENSDVKFDIYEYSAGSESLEDTVDATSNDLFSNIIDPDTGLETDMDIWIVPWVATHINDDDDTDPEYYFEAVITEPSGAVSSEDSGKTDTELLSVASCDDCGIECTLNWDNMFGQEGGGSGITPPCQKSIDCSGVSWSECNERGKMTRDTSLCLITGTGTMECEAQIRAMTPSEKMCSSSGALQKSAGGTSEETSCGDGYCDEGEDCPDDCGEESGFPWLWLLIALVIIGALAAGIIMAYNKKKESAGTAKPEDKKEAMPFAQQKDLDSVLGYIRAAKGKGYNDAQITEALKKAGWKDEQVKYGFGKINNPQQGAKPADTTNASAQSAAKPAQQAAQPVKK